MTKFLSSIIVLLLSLAGCASFHHEIGGSRAPASKNISPTPQNLLRTWEGESEAFSGQKFVDAPSCDKGEGATAEEPFGKICRTDTLYTWTTQAGLEARVESLKSSQWQGMWRPMYLARAPIASFGYGTVSLRVKLMPGVKFVRDRSRCTEISPSEAENSVYVNNFIVSEFLICSPKVIHSVSFGTKDHYDEIIRDYWQHLNKPSEASFYYRGNPPSLFKKEPSLDGTNFTEEKLFENLKTHLGLIEEQRQTFIFNPQSIKQFLSERGHFHTDYPIYFNDR